MEIVLKSIEMIIFDLDPLLLEVEQRALPPIATAVEYARNAGKHLRFTSNNSLQTRQEILTDLQQHGIFLQEHELDLPATHLAHWLSEESPRATIFLIGSDAVRGTLHQAGLRVIDNPEEIGYLCDYVVSGAAPTFAYPALLNAYRCFEMGAKFVAVEDEPVYHTQQGVIPGGGPVAAALRVIYDKPPAYVGGMPNAARLLRVADDLMVSPGSCLVISNASRSSATQAIECGMQVVVVGAEQDQLPQRGNDVSVERLKSIDELMDRLQQL